MDTGKDVSDFKRFIELNREKLYTNSVKADDISVNDEWMQENQWDEIYEIEENRMHVEKNKKYKNV